MKALLVADLHFNLRWFEWIEQEAETVDAVFLPGDLLDMFRSNPPLSMQAVAVRHWLRQLAKKCRVAFCSGNHDKYILIDRTFPAPNLIADGFTEVLEGFVITCVPYWCDEEEKAKYLNRGRAYRAGRKWTR
jgi:predicted MPP superfamily phosphohydrolase